MLSLGSALSPFRRDTRTINAAHPVNLKCWQTLAARCLVSESGGRGWSLLRDRHYTDLHLGRSFRVKHHVHCLSFKGCERNSRIKFVPNRPASTRAVLVKTRCAPRFPGGEHRIEVRDDAHQTQCSKTTFVTPPAHMETEILARYTGHVRSGCRGRRPLRCRHRAGE